MRFLKQIANQRRIHKIRNETISQLGLFGHVLRINDDRNEKKNIWREITWKKKAEDDQDRHGRANQKDLRKKGNRMGRNKTKNDRQEEVKENL